MNPNILAIKYGTGSPEELLGIIPNEELVQMIEDRLRLRLAAEFDDSQGETIADLERDLEDAEWDVSRAESATQLLLEAIQKCLDLPPEEGKLVLEKALEYHKQVYS